MFGVFGDVGVDGEADDGDVVGVLDVVGVVVKSLRIERIGRHIGIGSEGTRTRTSERKRTRRDEPVHYVK